MEKSMVIRILKQASLFLNLNGGLSKHIKGLKNQSRYFYIFQNGICKSYSSNRSLY